MVITDVIYQEATSGNGNVKVGILMYVGSGDPVRHLNDAVHYYVGNVGYNEFIDANMDNPWIRVIIKGLDRLDQVPFNSDLHHL